MGMSLHTPQTLYLILLYYWDEVLGNAILCYFWELKHWMSWNSFEKDRDSTVAHCKRTECYPNTAVDFASVSVYQVVAFRKRGHLEYILTDYFVDPGELSGIAFWLQQNSFEDCLMIENCLIDRGVLEKDKGAQFGNSVSAKVKRHQVWYCQT